jgi:hypothetical protein
VVFGAAGARDAPKNCPGLPFLRKWQTHGVEVVFVSLDEERQVFENFAGIFPFISICDYQKWESPVVKSLACFCHPNTLFA